jgi:hypothetical protein
MFERSLLIHPKLLMVVDKCVDIYLQQLVDEESEREARPWSRKEGKRKVRVKRRSFSSSFCICCKVPFPSFIVTDLEEILSLLYLIRSDEGSLGFVFLSHPDLVVTRP